MKQLVRLAIKIVILLILAIACVFLASYFSSFATRAKVENKTQPKIEKWLHKIVQNLLFMQDCITKGDILYVRKALQVVIHSILLSTYFYGAEYLQFIANKQKQNPLVKRLVAEQDAELAQGSAQQKQEREFENEEAVFNLSDLVRTKSDVWAAILEKVNALNHQTKYFHWNQLVLGKKESENEKEEKVAQEEEEQTQIQWIQEKGKKQTEKNTCLQIQELEDSQYSSCNNESKKSQTYNTTFSQHSFERELFLRYFTLAAKERKRKKSKMLLKRQTQTLQQNIPPLTMHDI